jgi:phage tail-like protein
MHPESGFIYLNIAGQWPSFDLHGIVIAADGALELSRTGGQFVSRGLLMAGPIQAPNGSTDWFLLRAFSEAVPSGTHTQFFTATSNAGAPPFDPNAVEPFSDPSWHALPRDVMEGVISNPPGASLWIGLILRSQGSESPRIHQMRTDYGRDTYLTWLPAIYRKEPQSRFLERYLALYAGVLGPVEAKIAGLTRLFDPFAAPDHGFPSWLEWLAGWLTFDLKEQWTDHEKRRYLSKAFELYGWRGTIEGLRRYLKIYAGVNARITDASRFSQKWTLGEVSTLGFGTRLAPGPMQGAVVGSTAIVDQARVIPGDDPGGSLYEDTAHLFCVQVYLSDLNQPGAIETVRQVLDREKPAHTVYQLSIIEPRMRIGAQSRIGIDTIIAEGPPPAQIGMRLGGSVLVADAAPCPNPEDMIHDTNIRTC